MSTQQEIVIAGHRLVFDFKDRPIVPVDRRFMQARNTCQILLRDKFGLSNDEAFSLIMLRENDAKPPAYYRVDWQALEGAVHPG